MKPQDDEPLQEDMRTIVENFASTQNKSDISEILKELFDVSKISLITDISDDEARLITRLITVAKIKGFTAWEECISLFLQLKISTKRQSRKEIIEAIKGFYGAQIQRKGFLGFGR